MSFSSAVSLNFTAIRKPATQTMIRVQHSPTTFGVNQQSPPGNGPFCHFCLTQLTIVIVSTKTRMLSVRSVLDDVAAKSAVHSDTCILQLSSTVAMSTFGTHTDVKPKRYCKKQSITHLLTKCNILGVFLHLLAACGAAPVSLSWSKSSWGWNQHRPLHWLRLKLFQPFTQETHAH